jgi:hypothetical protein
VGVEDVQADMGRANSIIEEMKQRLEGMKEQEQEGLEGGAEGEGRKERGKGDGESGSRELQVAQHHGIAASAAAGGGGGGGAEWVGGEAEAEEAEEGGRADQPAADDAAWWKRQQKVLNRLFARLQEELLPMTQRPDAYGLDKKRVGRMRKQLGQAQAWHAFVVDAYTHTQGCTMVQQGRSKKGKGGRGNGCGGSGGSGVDAADPRASDRHSSRVHTVAAGQKSAHHDNADVAEGPCESESASGSSTSTSTSTSGSSSGGGSARSSGGLHSFHHANSIALLVQSDSVTTGTPRGVVSEGKFFVRAQRKKEKKVRRPQQ